LGHEDHPELGLEPETACTSLAKPLPVAFVQLTGKHFDEQMEPGAFVALSQRAAVIEVSNPLPVYSNVLVRLEAVEGETEASELYAKVSRPFDESGNRYLMHFTSVSPRVRARLNRLLEHSA
jgi:hypothetical protein